MNTRIVASTAGTKAAKHVHHGLPLNGSTTQPRPDQEGSIFPVIGTSNFGVSTLRKKSTTVMAIRARMTAKSETMPRIVAVRYVEVLNCLNNLPREISDIIKFELFGILSSSVDYYFVRIYVPAKRTTQVMNTLGT